MCFVAVAVQEGGRWKWKSTMRRILCIRFPGWPVMRLAAARPELKNRPIVLYEISRGARRVVAWGIEKKREQFGHSVCHGLLVSRASADKQQHCLQASSGTFLPGISEGMPLGEAVSLVGSSAGDLHLEEYDPVADREA